MFKSEVLNQIIDSIPAESSSVKIKALCILTLVQSLLDEYTDNGDAFDEIINDIYIVCKGN